jgi:hypothetical protein
VSEEQDWVARDNFVTEVWIIRYFEWVCEAQDSRKGNLFDNPVSTTVTGGYQSYDEGLYQTSFLRKTIAPKQLLVVAVDSES